MTQVIEGSRAKKRALIKHKEHYQTFQGPAPDPCPDKLRGSRFWRGLIMCIMFNKTPIWPVDGGQRSLSDLDGKVPANRVSGRTLPSCQACHRAVRHRPLPGSACLTKPRRHRDPDPPPCRGGPCRAKEDP